MRSEMCENIKMFHESILCPALQMTDVELDVRVTALEEKDGGSGQNGIWF